MRQLLAILLTATLVACGCAARHDSAPSASPAAADPLGRGDERPPSPGGLALASVFPFIASDASDPPASFVARFEVVEGKHAGKTLLLTQQRLLGAPRWSVVRQIEGDATPIERRVQELREGPSLYLVEFWNDERGVRVVFDPDPLTMPATLEPGATASSEQKMTLPTIANPKRIRERGTGRMDLTYIADQTITTPAGTFDAARTREVYTSKLKNATATRTIDRWHAPGVGLVAERWEETVTILGGITAERSVHAMRLRELPVTAE